MSGIKNLKRNYLKPGKKTREWDLERARLKKKFYEWGITHCEINLPGCCREVHGFAHVDKRRNLAPSELSMVVAACNPCHDKVEIMPDMREKLTKIINARNTLLRARGEVI